MDEASAHSNELPGEDVQAAISVGDQRPPTCVIRILPESKRRQHQLNAFSRKQKKIAKEEMRAIECRTDLPKKF